MVPAVTTGQQPHHLLVSAAVPRPLPRPGRARPRQQRCARPRSSPPRSRSRWTAA